MVSLRTAAHGMFAVAVVANFEDVRLKKGEHTLAATVDSKGTVAETSDDDNTLTVTAACTAA